MENWIKDLAGFPLSRSSLACLATLLFVVLGEVRPAFAFDWGVFTSLTPAMKMCIGGDMVENELQEVLTFDGNKPRDKSLRRSSKKAYKRCLKKVLKAGKDTGGAVCGPMEPRYRGRLFDAMAQVDERDLQDVMGLVKDSSVTRVALFARSRKFLGQNEIEVQTLAKAHPKFLILGVPKFFRFDGRVGDDYIDAAISGIRDHGYAFVGEILFTHGDKSHGETTSTGERYINPSNPGVKTLLRRLAGLERPVPLMTHWEVYSWDRDWPLFSELYRAYPSQVFIMPHMGFGSVQQMEVVLSQNPNVFITTSKKEKKKGGYSDASKSAKLGDGFLDNCGKLKNKWRELLIRYKDRILFATDAHKSHRWMVYRKLIERGRAWLGQLPHDTAKAIAFENAERLYGRK